jgi:hypothetical protein
VGLSFPSKPLRESAGVAAALVQPWNDLVSGLRATFAQVPRVYFAEVTLRTTSPLTTGFPFSISIPKGMVPRCVLIARVQNLDVSDVTISHSSALSVDWRPSDDGVTIRFIHGLFALVNYQVVFRVEGD